MAMDVLIKLAVPLLTEMSRVAEGGGLARRGALAGGCAVAAGLLALAAIGCAIAALWICLVPLVGPAVAPLVCAGALLILAGLCLLVGRLAWGRRRGGSDALLQSLRGLDASGFFSEHKTTLLIGALVLGLIAGSGAGGGKRPER